MSAALKHSAHSTTAAAAASETACEVARLPHAVHAPGLQNASYLDTHCPAIGAKACKTCELLVFSGHCAS